MQSTRRRWFIAIGTSAIITGMCLITGVPLVTGQTTDLRGVTPNWDKFLPANNTGDPCNSSRFSCVLNGQAVRGNETGLVWERTPQAQLTTWANARTNCATKNVGGRKRWRLPSFAELASLVDSANVGPALPPGHPFTNVQATSAYWSASVSAADTAAAWYVIVFNGNVATTSKGSTHYVWCVRGGMNHERY